MGSQGGAAPNGLRIREVRTLFLRAPTLEWSALAQGYKTEFRAKRRGAVTLHAPSPVVLYAVAGTVRREKLMVLVEHATERLMDIGDQPESLRREGFESYDHFRRYWRARTGKPFRPMDQVEVFRLAAWDTWSPEVLGAVLVERLYADFLDGAHELRSDDRAVQPA